MSLASFRFVIITKKLVHIIISLSSHTSSRFISRKKCNASWILITSAATPPQPSQHDNSLHCHHVAVAVNHQKRCVSDMLCVCVRHIFPIFVNFSFAFVMKLGYVHAFLSPPPNESSHSTCCIPKRIRFLHACGWSAGASRRVSVCQAADSESLAVSASGLTTIVFPQILEIGCWLVGRGVNKRFPILNEWAARHCLSFRAFDFLACRNRSHRNNSHLLPAMMGNVCCLTMSEPLPGESILGNYVSVSLICWKD